jgi:methionyl-tRNA formyltransferase
MRVGFAGTPAFAAAALAAVIDAGFDVAIALTRPDRPRGRGMKLEPSPVKALAQSRGVEVLQTPTLRTAEARAQLLAVPLDVLVVAAYGLILPPEVLAWPRHGCVNVHASLLPRWRGAAPIQRAILAGDRETGITIMRMDEGLDTGPMIEAARVPIEPHDTGGSLEAALAREGAAAIVRTLARLARDGRVEAVPQPEHGVTYAAKIDRADAVIDWRDDSAAIDRKVRAFDPAPGASTSLRGAPLKVWHVEASSSPSAGAAPGSVIAAARDGIVVACGNGLARIVEIQPAGRRRMSAADFLAGHAVAAGDRFDVLPPAATERASSGANN